MANLIISVILGAVGGHLIARGVIEGSTITFLIGVALIIFGALNKFIIGELK